MRDKNLTYCRCVKVIKAPEMTQDCHSLWAHSQYKGLPPPPLPSPSTITGLSRASLKIQPIGSEEC